MKRPILALFAITIALGELGLGIGTSVRAEELAAVDIQPLPTYSVDTLAPGFIPPDLGQTQIQVYIPESEHTVRGYMLDYWRANGASSVFGNPISEPFASFDGRYSQAFQSALLQYYPELVWTDEPSVRLMDVPPMIMDRHLDSFRDDGRRGGGGGDRRSSAWKPVASDGRTAQQAYASGGTWDEATGHTIDGAFYNWYISHEGEFYLGTPISQPMQESGRLVQYFQAAVLQQDSDGVVTLSPIVQMNADWLGIDQTPAPYEGQPNYDEELFWEGQNPNPQGDPYAAGRKWIEVSISQQRLWAYQGDTLITTTLVSTGLDPNPTEEGWFHVRYKLEKTDMAGQVNDQGQVVGFDDPNSDSPNALQPGESEYQVKDIPHVMYFDYDAEALHGAYWHNNFGNKMSHGCVNLPLDMATFLYGWAPLGTVVWVHQ